MKAFASVLISVVLAGSAARASGAQVVHPGVISAGDELLAIVPGTRIYVVESAAGPRPLFDTGAALLTESAPYEELEIGDIVILRDPQSGESVVERILRRREDGDLMAGSETLPLTPSTYLGRVFGVFYASAPPEVSLMTASANPPASATP